MIAAPSTNLASRSVLLSHLFVTAMLRSKTAFPFPRLLLAAAGLALALSPAPAHAVDQAATQYRTSGKKTSAGPPFAILCLESSAVPDREIVERNLSKWLATGSEHAISDLVVNQLADQAGPIAISFGYDGRRFAAGLIDRPIPASDLDYACGNAIFWPEAAAVLGRQRSHLIVSALGDYDQPWQRALRLSQVMAACIESFEGSLGVYWGHASVVHAPEFFLQGMREAGEDAALLPVELWTGFLRTERRDGTADMYTDGLDVFGCMEFEIVASKQPMEEMFEMLIGMSRYVIANGNMFRDGDTVGADEQEKIPTHFADSVIGRRPKVILIDY